LKIGLEMPKASGKLQKRGRGGVNGKIELRFFFC